MVNGRRGRRMYRPKPGEVWVCAKCGKPIEELPFDPQRDENGNLSRPVYHRECLPPKNR
jgi:hypothetical protein